MKTIKYITKLAMTLLISVSAYSQQDPNFNMYRFNMNIINPAYAGTSATPELQIMHKSQWLGIEDAPQTQTAFYHQPLKGNIGVGASINMDRIFVLEQSNLGIDISYKLALTDTYNLFFGVKPGMSFTSIDLTRVGRDGESDGLFERTESYVAPIFGAGVYLRSDKLYATLSVPNFVNGERFIRDEGSPTAVTNKPHVYLGGGYTITINKDLDITPEFIIRGVEGAPNSYNMAINGALYKRINFGANYRVEENMAFYALFKTTGYLDLGFGYDFTTSKVIQSNNNYSLEFLAKYRFL